jgi:hypothetical protein
MAIQTTCEGCGRRVKVPDHAAGRKGQCPACGREILVPGGNPTERTAAESTAAPAADGEWAARDNSGPGASAPRGTNALGVASLVLGILALLIAWIPLLGLLAWLLGGLGLLLGLIGLVLAARNRRWGTALPVVGLATNGAAVALVMVVTLWAGRTLQDAARSVQVVKVAGAVQQDAPRAPAKAQDTPAPDAPAPKGPAPREAPPPKALQPDGTFAGQDRNGDGRLNADEVPDALRARFAEVDTDGNGYVDKAEWDRAAAPASDAKPARGKVIAQRIYTAADDFVVDVWHNGRRVPDDKREMVGETYGATAEKIEIEVREGDWLVFNVANNRFRWGGVCYFGAAGINEQERRVAFVTDPADGRWSYCDDPGRVSAFIAHAGYLADQAAQAPANPWPGGDNEMKSRVPDWNGRPIWGRERTTWLKFVARPAPAGLVGGKPRPPATPADLAVELKKRATLTGHPGLVFCVAVTPDGRKVVSGSAPHFDLDSKRQDVKTLIVWDVADQGKTRLAIPLEQSIESLAVTPDGRSVVAPTDNGLSVFDLKTGRRTLVLPGPPRKNAMRVAVSPDGKVAAGGFLTHEIILWNLKTGKPLRTLLGHTGNVTALAFSPDSKQLASGAQDHTVRLWDAATGRAERTLAAEGASSPVSSVAYLPDGSRLASVNIGDPPRFWEPASGRPLSTLDGDKGLGYHSIGVSRNGRRLATTALDPRTLKGVVVLWDAATGRRLATAADGDGPAGAVAFTPDGSAVVSSGGNTVKIWDIVPAPEPAARRSG